MIKELKGGCEIEVEKLNNGLTVYFIPFKGRNKYYSELLVNYGSLINKFKSINEKRYTTYPFGIAHFLEHKLFEEESKIDPFTYFSMHGTDCNASTSYKYTNYYISGVFDHKECLDYLIKYVNSPYFTNKNVEKEKGIITEELNMYNDNPYTRLYRRSLECIFKKHNVRVDVGGTPSSIKKITPKDLYKCYNAFYKPLNMTLFVAGNYDKKEVYEVLKNNDEIISNKDNTIIDVSKEVEPYDVNIKFDEMSLKGLKVPKMIYAFKSSLAGFSTNNKFLYEFIVDLILYNTYGASSKFYLEGLKEKRLTDVSFNTSIIDDFLITEIVVESENPKELIPLIKEYYDNTSINLLDIRRYVKARLVDEVNSYDFVDTIVDSIRDDLLDFGEVIYNKIDLMKTVSLEEVNKIKDGLDFDNTSIVIANPK